MSKAAQNSTPQRIPLAAASRDGSAAVSAAPLLAKAPQLQAALGAWYRAHRRRLPWREQPSLYKTVVSEFMLQQTQVETVLPYFDRWLKKFPDFKALAAAREAAVMKLWEGLGYYRRARLLHALARDFIKLPAPPTTPEEWIELPGIGPYTAAAISSIAFSAPAAVVDGNVVRVLARLLGNRMEFKDSSTAVKAFTPAANELLDASNPGDHNQAMMELGATVCTRRNPHCTICPLVTACVAAAQGDPESLPRLAAKKMLRTELTRLWIERDGALLLHRKAATSRRLANQCELPDATSLPSAIVDRTPLAIKRRTIVNQIFVESIHRASLPKNAPDAAKNPGAGFIWATPARLAQLTLSGPHRRWVEELRGRYH